MTERYGHRDDENREADASAQVVDAPLLYGADHLTTDAAAALGDADGYEDSANEDTVDG
jgi:hypothetical protein